MEAGQQAAEKGPTAATGSIFTAEQALGARLRGLPDASPAEIGSMASWPLMPKHRCASSNARSGEERPVPFL